MFPSIPGGTGKAGEFRGTAAGLLGLGQAVPSSFHLSGVRICDQRFVFEGERFCSCFVWGPRLLISGWPPIFRLESQRWGKSSNTVDGYVNYITFLECSIYQEFKKFRPLTQ